MYNIQKQKVKTNKIVGFTHYSAVVGSKVSAVTSASSVPEIVVASSPVEVEVAPVSPADVEILGAGFFLANGLEDMPALPDARAAERRGVAAPAGDPLGGIGLGGESDAEEVDANWKSVTFEENEESVLLLVARCVSAVVLLAGPPLSGLENDDTSPAFFAPDELFTGAAALTSFMSIITTPLVVDSRLSLALLFQAPKPTLPNVATRPNIGRLSFCSGLVVVDPLPSSPKSFLKLVFFFLRKP
jgi:hypothetical protein